jgi:hypothetical protein
MATILFDRQKRLLGLLNALGGDVGNLDFQKLLFLFCQSQQTPAYEFVPYKFGAFSFSSYADRRKMIERGLIDQDERSWRLTPEGREVANRLRVGVPEAAAFAHAHRALRGDALVADTYRRFPYFGIRSEIAERLLAGDSAALAQIANTTPTAAGPRIASIGYEGQTLEGYLNRLIRSGITVLCDVRRNAISRKYGFSKSTLANACTSVAIRYEHLPELGIASEQRQGLDQPGVRHALFADYTANLLPHQQSALDRIRGWLTDGESVALTCFERLSEDCHRHCVVEALLPTLGGATQPLHL